MRLKLRNLDQVVRLDENEPGDKAIRYFEARTTASCFCAE